MRNTLHIMKLERLLVRYAALEDAAEAAGDYIRMWLYDKKFKECANEINRIEGK